MSQQTGEKRWIQLATRYRYSLPVLAELQRDQGCKFVTLIRRLDASDRAIRQALDYLIEIGWAMPNPGYGHPLRPEYVLTPEGGQFGLQALEVWDALREWNEQGVALERWPLQILQGLQEEVKRFAQIQRGHEGLTPRALTLALTTLQESGLITRTLVDGKPPTAEYVPTRWGEEMRRVLGTQCAVRSLED